MSTANLSRRLDNLEAANVADDFAGIDVVGEVEKAAAEMRAILDRHIAQRADSEESDAAISEPDIAALVERMNAAAAATPLGREYARRKALMV